MAVGHRAPPLPCLTAPGSERPGEDVDRRAARGEVSAHLRRDFGGIPGHPTRRDPVIGREESIRARVLVYAGGAVPNSVARRKSWSLRHPGPARTPTSGSQTRDPARTPGVRIRSVRSVTIILQ